MYETAETITSMAVLVAVIGAVVWVPFLTSLLGKVLFVRSVARLAALLPESRRESWIDEQVRAYEKARKGGE